MPILPYFYLRNTLKLDNYLRIRCKMAIIQCRRTGKCQLKQKTYPFHFIHQFFRFQLKNYQMELKIDFFN